MANSSLKPNPYKKIPIKIRGVERAVFDEGQGTDREDADDHEFDKMRQDEGGLDEDNTLNNGSSAMSDQLSNGPGNKFGSRFNE